MSSETPLDSIQDLPSATRAKLKGRWITSVEQLVAHAATPGGRSQLAALLDAELPAIEALVARARAALPAGLVAQLEQPTPQDHGMGALKPPCQEQEEESEPTTEPPLSAPEGESCDE